MDELPPNTAMVLLIWRKRAAGAIERQGRRHLTNRHFDSLHYQKRAADCGKLQSH